MLANSHWQRVFSKRKGPADVLFIWPTKCAGTSIANKLIVHGACKMTKSACPYWAFPNRGMATFGHASFDSLMRKGYLSKSYFQRAFKFGFVRNPFDRLVSLYFHAQKTKRPDAPIDLFLPFEEFCIALKQAEINPLGLYNARRLSAFNPMVRWLCNSQGGLHTDFLGRYENLHEDFRVVAGKIGIDPILPHHNATSHPHYRALYTPVARQIAEELYREDLERFSYDF